MNDWTSRFEAWQNRADALRAKGERITRVQHAKGIAIAVAHGLPANPTMIHNARCDVRLQGWCKDNPARLDAATRAMRYLDDWRASNVASRMIQRDLRALTRTE